MVIAIALESGFALGVLSSKAHEVWTLAACSWMGVGNDPRYNKTLCFDPFPFPAATPVQQASIGALAEELDAHRKTRMAEHPHLTLTGLYNVLDALRAGRALTPAEHEVLDAGQVVVLQHLHDRLDAAVAGAYGWPADLPAAEIVARVVALNKERAAAAAQGQVRWLRPDFQAPEEVRRQAAQPALEVDQAAVLPRWPAKPAEQFVALRAALAQGGPARPAELARQFQGAPDRKLAEMLRALAALGQAREAGAGRYVA